MVELLFVLKVLYVVLMLVLGLCPIAMMIWMGVVYFRAFAGLFCGD